MKTTFDLPDTLLHKAKAVAARQGRPLRDLVSEALLRAVTEEERLARSGPNAGSEWDLFLAKLELQPDGTYINPDGIQDERFFEILEILRSERLMQPLRDPFEGFGPGAVVEPGSTERQQAPAPTSEPAPAEPSAGRKKLQRR